MAWTFAVALLAGCSREPPPVCAAYLECFYPEGEDSPYLLRDDERALGSDGKRAEMLATFGPGGECWRNGSIDALWETCEGVCEAVLWSECRAFGEQGVSSCVEGAREAPVFKPPGGSTPAVSCDSLEAPPDRSGTAAAGDSGPS